MVGQEWSAGQGSLTHAPTRHPQGFMDSQRPAKRLGHTKDFVVFALGQLKIPFVTEPVCGASPFFFAELCLKTTKPLMLPSRFGGRIPAALGPADS